VWGWDFNVFLVVITAVLHQCWATVAWYVALAACVGL
jgi:hypothetical protein